MLFVAINIGGLSPMSGIFRAALTLSLFFPPSSDGRERIFQREKGEKVVIFQNRQNQNIEKRYIHLKNLKSRHNPHPKPKSCDENQ